MTRSIFDELKQQQDLALKALNKTFSLQAKGLLHLGLNRLELLEWLCEGVHARQILWCPYQVGTMGSGPWDITEFDALLDSMGFKLAHLPNPTLEVVVLGADGWDKDVIESQVYDRDGSDLIVLSQELFIAGVLKKENPLKTIDEDVLKAIAQGHSAISYLIDRGFEWPVGAISEDVEEWEVTTELASESPLHKAGYSVAANGPTVEQRRAILDGFFSGRIAAKLPTAEDKKRWGKPRSAQRLYSMATFMSWLCRFQGSKAPNALTKWQKDMSWLKQNFFKSTMRFSWPSAKPMKRSPLRPAPAAVTTLSPQAVWPFPTAAKASARPKISNRERQASAPIWTAKGSISEQNRPTLSPQAAWPFATTSKP